MPQAVDGLYLSKYVDPILLKERKNYRADFMRVLPGVPDAAVSLNGIIRNKLINNVAFSVNRTEDFEAVNMGGQNVTIPWEIYDTAPTSCSDAEMFALTFNKRDEIRNKHNESFQLGIRNHVLHKLAPTSNQTDLPIFRTTGEVTATGRRRMCFADLVGLGKWATEQSFAVEGQVYIVLSAQHQADLVLDKDATVYFRDRSTFIDAATGMTKPFMGLQFFQNNDTPYFNISTGEKLAENGIYVAGTHEKASTLFYAPNTYYHINAVKSLYSPETQDTVSASPTSKFRTQTYGIVSRVEEYGAAAIISGYADTYEVSASSTNTAQGTVTPSAQTIVQGANATLVATAHEGFKVKAWVGVTSSTGIGTGSSIATLVGVNQDTAITVEFEAIA